jgi:predicted  nucleic acid-binding Zn-ribbon protein
MTASRGISAVDPIADELQELRAEVERLRELVGPSEDSYEKLRLDVLGARDAARAAEIQAGALRARVVQLEVMITGYERDFEWFRDNAIRRLQSLKRYVPTVRNLARRAARR